MKPVPSCSTPTFIVSHGKPKFRKHHPFGVSFYILPHNKHLYIGDGLWLGWRTGWRTHIFFKQPAISQRRCCWIPSAGVPSDTNQRPCRAKWEDGRVNFWKSWENKRNLMNACLNLGKPGRNWMIVMIVMIVQQELIRSWLLPNKTDQKLCSIANSWAMFDQNWQRWWWFLTGGYCRLRWHLNIMFWWTSYVEGGVNICHRCVCVCLSTYDILCQTGYIYSSKHAVDFPMRETWLCIFCK